jgi:hypothetical protein
LHEKKRKFEFSNNVVAHQELFVKVDGFLWQAIKNAVLYEESDASTKLGTKFQQMLRE